MTKTKNNHIQLLRALAIIAVVCIHTCPLGLPQVFIRPFINFAVALFVFLSGYLTKIENNNWPSFYKKRIIRVIIPYIIWNIIYWTFDSIRSTENITLLPKYLFFASARAHLYYVPVYIGLVLITPLVGMLTRSRYHHIAWIISPLYMIVFFYTQFIPKHQLDPSIIKISGLFFFSWFSYYYMGIVLGNKLSSKRINIKVLYYLLFLTLLVQIAESYILYHGFNFANCGTQGKLSVLLTNLVFLLIIYMFLTNDKIRIKNTILIRIGDYSFGIYLCHVLFINIFEGFSFYREIPFPINSLLILLISICFCYVCDKILDSRMIRYLGIK